MSEIDQSPQKCNSRKKRKNKRKTISKSMSSSSSAPSGKKRKAVEIGPLTPENLCDLNVDELAEIALKLEQDDLQALMSTALQSADCWKYGNILWEIYLAKFHTKLKVYSLKLWHKEHLERPRVLRRYPSDEARSRPGFENWYQKNFLNEIEDASEDDWLWDFGLVFAESLERAMNILFFYISEGTGISLKAKMFTILRENLISDPRAVHDVYSDEQFEMLNSGWGFLWAAPGGNRTEFKMEHFLAFIDPEPSLLEEESEEEKRGRREEEKRREEERKRREEEESEEEGEEGEDLFV